MEASPLALSPGEGGRWGREGGREGGRERGREGGREGGRGGREREGRDKCWA